MNNKIKHKSIIVNKKIIFTLFKVAFSFFNSICILSIISFFYKYNGIRVKNESGATDYKWPRNQIMCNCKEGFSMFRFDENGFNNVQLYNEIDILLMGSSFMEGVHIKKNQNIGYLLNKYVNKYKTYNIGISGHTIYRNVDNLESALEYYKPSKYVIIETTSINFDEISMLEVLNKNSKRLKYDTKISSIFKHIPALKLIISQFIQWIEQPSNNEYSIDTIRREINITTTRLFLKEIARQAEKYNIKPIILFIPFQKLGNNGELIYWYDEQEMKTIENICSENNIDIINVKDYFDKIYITDKILVHGFINTEIGAGHLNKYGHKAMLDSLLDYFKLKDSINVQFN